MRQYINLHVQKKQNNPYIIPIINVVIVLNFEYIKPFLFITNNIRKGYIITSKITKVKPSIANHDTNSY